MNKKVPRGLRNNNPFNIIDSKTKWQGESDKNDDPKFEEFEDMVIGIRAGMVILRSYMLKYKLNTISKIINRFAPTVENDTKAYIEAVAKRTGFGKDQKLTFDKYTICRLTEAICHHENGGDYITTEQINKAWEKV